MASGRALITLRARFYREESRVQYTCSEQDVHDGRRRAYGRCCHPVGRRSEVQGGVGEGGHGGQYPRFIFLGAF